MFFKMQAVGQTENLTELENLNENTLLLELQARYNRDTIYVSLNLIIIRVLINRTQASKLQHTQEMMSMCTLIEKKVNIETLSSKIK